MSFIQQCGMAAYLSNQSDNHSNDMEVITQYVKYMWLELQTESKPKTADP